jgi:hypothetical protein
MCKRLTVHGIKRAINGSKDLPGKRFACLPSAAPTPISGSTTPMFRASPKPAKRLSPSKSSRETLMTESNSRIPPDGFAPVSASSAQALAESMEEPGAGILHHIVPDAILAQRIFVAHQIEQHGRQYFGFEGNARIAGICVHPSFEDAGLHALLRCI